MKEEFLERIPDEIMSIIFNYIRPSIKYSLTKNYFYKFYFIRFGYINNRILLYYVKSLRVYECYIIKNFNYIKFLLKNDLLMMLKNIIEYKLKNDRSNYILKKPIIFQNMKFKNFIELSYSLSIKFKSNKILDYLNKIIDENGVKVSNKLKKYDNSNSSNKNMKNKQIRWIA